MLEEQQQEEVVEQEEEVEAPIEVNLHSLLSLNVAQLPFKYVFSRIF